MAHGAFQTIDPSEESLAWISRNYRWLRPIFTTLFRMKFNFTVSGAEHLPRSGPCLIMTNHAAQWDAAHINWGANRPVIFLTAASLLRDDSPRSRFLRAMGMIPKKKFVSDMRAVRTLKGWVDSGAAVGMFPEGERSWDGNPLPILPGVEKLVRLLGAPLVTGRIHNADRQWPRWAEKPRLGRVHLEFDPPRAFSRQTPLPEIRSYIEERVTLPPEASDRYRTWGLNLAQGLPNLLFLCPACGELETLREHRAEVECGACTAAWRVTTDNRMEPVRGGAGPLTIAQAASRIRSALDEGWVPDRERHRRDKVLLESRPGRLFDQSGDEPRDLGEVRVLLTEDELVLDSPSGEVRICREELRAISIEQRRRLWLMTSDRILEPDLPADSMVKWGWMLQRWRERDLSAGQSSR